MGVGLSKREHLDEIFASLYKAKSPDSSALFSYIQRLLVQFRLKNAYEVKDIVVEIYARGIKSIEQGKVIENPQAWIKRVALNVIREFRRAADKVQYNALDDQSPLIASENNMLSDLVYEDDLAIIRQAFNALSEQDKTILYLRIVEGLSWQEINLRLSYGDSSLSENYLRQKGFRALRRLRAVYDSKQEDFQSFSTVVD
jgi:RNA polymerase sigma factor (sigma-70 family)